MLDLESAPDGYDWQLAYLRSEMLRQFQAEYLPSVSHELRSPISSQIGVFDLMLSGLCDSVEEMTEFAASAKTSAQNHLKLILDCVELSSYSSPVLPFQPSTIHLQQVLQPVFQLTQGIARDRGLHYTVTDTDLEFKSDAQWLEQALLGLVSWGLQRMLHGDFTITLQSPREAPYIQLSMAGKLTNLDSQDTLNWSVPHRLMEVMGGVVKLVDLDPNKSATIDCYLAM